MGDCQIALALQSFIEEKGRELVERNLYRNFVLHCCNLFEFGVVGPAPVFAAVTRMQQFMKLLQQQDDKAASPLLEWPEQRTRWMERSGKAASASARRDFSGIFPKDKKEEIAPRKK